MNNKIIVLGNSTEWCKVSLNDLKNIDNTLFINDEFPIAKNKKIKNYLAKIHFSRKINNKIRLPFKRIWYKGFLKYIFGDCRSNVILIIYDRNKLANYPGFLNYLKKRIKNLKLIYLFTNIVKYSGAQENNFVNNLNKYYDLVYAFDPVDSKKYDFKYHPLLYSKLDDYDKLEKNDSVFYVGKSKDRYPMLISIYKFLKDNNINTNFYIFGVDEDKQQFTDEITYNKYISYYDCVKNISTSKCLIDVIQGDSEGFTIKVCEAVYYDKLLITTNKNVVDMPFYDKNNILVIDSEKDIDIIFIKNNSPVPYSKEGKDVFSVEHFINTLYNDLNELSVKK